jgi:two-component system nitrogen regulation sensor histidine kinase GlnL
VTEDAGHIVAALDSVRVGILAVDSRGHVQLQNPEASRILGVSRKAFQGRLPAEVLGEAHPAVVLLSQVLSTNREVSLNECTIRPRPIGDRELLADLTASPISVGDGVQGAVLTLHDRTIGRELEAMVRQHARTESYAQLASGIAHEIKNPLSGIRGAAELLEARLAGLELEKGLQRYPELIRTEADRIRRLLDDFMELTRGAELRPRPMNLHEVLDRMIALHSQSEGWSAVDVVREYDPSIPEIELDPDRITQIFLNLLRNAVQALEGRGKVTIRTRVETLYHLSAGHQDPLRMLRIEVEDDGPGIPEEDLPHVFTPFFTRREQGTGLGLALAEHWVVKHGGQIALESSTDGGTRVRILLPVRNSL